MSRPDYLLVGYIAGAHGIAGEVKLRPLTEFPERILDRKVLRLRSREGEGEIREFAVRGGRKHGEMILLRLEGVPVREEAEALRGWEAVILPEEAAPLPEGRFYEHEIIGLRAVTSDGEELATITSIIPGASNDVYVAGPWLIPATHDAVERVDPAAGVLVVRSRAYLEGEEVR